jgi:hypothetical protein
LQAKPIEDESMTIHKWLKQLRLEKYARAFVKAEIDWESVLELTDEDLVSKLKHDAIHSAVQKKNVK